MYFIYYLAKVIYLKLAIGSGLSFRNHIYANQISTSELLLVCDKKLINENNMNEIMKSSASKWQIIVEGQSCFSQYCREYLEKKGALFFKDISTNKGIFE